MDAEEGVDSHSRITTLTIADSEQPNAGASKSRGEDNPLIELPIFLIRGDKGTCTIQPLNVPARNLIVHKSPALVKHVVAEARQRQANKEGFYEDTDCVVRWKPSAIPFHTEFEISVSNNTCQHLASVRNIISKDPDRHAKNLVPLAKVFLGKPPGTHLPHLPFIRPQLPSDNRSSRNAEDKQTTETIRHARLILRQHNTLTEIEIDTAEATARMVNAGRIIGGLLVYLTTFRPRTEDAVTSAESPKADPEEVQPTTGPFPADPKRPKPVSSADKLQGLGPVSKHERVVSNLEDDAEAMIVRVKDTLGESTAPEEALAVGKSLPKQPAATIKSSNGKKAYKKNKQGGKTTLSGRSRNEATPTVSAYPTQRPPRKKRARKSTITRKSLQEKRLETEEYDLEQEPLARPPTLEESDHEEDTPEQILIPEVSSQKDFASRESASDEDEESQALTAKEIVKLEETADEIRSCPSDIVYSEDLITATDKTIALSPPTKPIQMCGSGVQGLLWAYATEKKDEKALSKAGVWLWRKPQTHFRTQSLLRSKEFGFSLLAPVVISHERTGDDKPIVESDGSIVHIVPHKQHWEDVRSHESHPDFLVPWKLAEYQATEAAGYQVWRHDRDLLECHKPGCNAMVSDFHHSAVVCLGCGPKSVIRYCSLQHQLEDIKGHWKECGNWTVLPQCVIDRTTAPGKLALMCPAIKRIHGVKSAALYRQTLYSVLNHGHYTLLNPAMNWSKTICWPKQDPKWPEMDRRIERLLNIAFLDGWNHYILGYLYRLLRELLRSQGKWSESTERSLKLQFESEFRNYKVNTNRHNGDAPCQCEWSGRILPRYDHLPTCRQYDPKGGDYGPAQPQVCIEKIVNDYEKRFWILRAWRQQHPTQSDWRLRAAGHGFRDMIPDERCYKLGPGWTGWGGEEDNIGEDQGYYGEGGNMQWV